MYSPQVPTHPIRRRLFDVVSHRYFDGFIMFCVWSSFLLMATRHYMQHAVWDRVLWVANIFYITVFAAEAVLKFTALGARQFVRQKSQVGAALC